MSTHATTNNKNKSKSRANSAPAPCPPSVLSNHFPSCSSACLLLPSTPFPFSLAVSIHLRLRRYIKLFPPLLKNANVVYKITEDTSFTCLEKRMNICVQVLSNPFKDGRGPSSTISALHSLLLYLSSPIKCSKTTSRLMYPERYVDEEKKKHHQSQQGCGSKEEKTQPSFFSPMVTYSIYLHKTCILHTSEIPSLSSLTSLISNCVWTESSSLIFDLDPFTLGKHIVIDLEKDRYKFYTSTHPYTLINLEGESKFEVCDSDLSVARNVVGVEDLKRLGEEIWGKENKRKTLKPSVLQLRLLFYHTNISNDYTKHKLLSSIISSSPLVSPLTPSNLPPLTLNDCTVCNLLMNVFQRHEITETDQPTTLSNVMYYKIINIDTQNCICVITENGRIFTHSSNSNFKVNLSNFLFNNPLPKCLSHTYLISHTKKSYFDTTLTRKIVEDKKTDDDDLTYVNAHSIITLDYINEHVMNVRVKSFNNCLPGKPILQRGTEEVAEGRGEAWVESYFLEGGKELVELLGVRREEKGNFLRTGSTEWRKKWPSGRVCLYSISSPLLYSRLKIVQIKFWPNLMDSKFENVLGKILGSDKDCEKAVKYWKSLVEYGSLEYLEEVLAYATRSFVELGRELEESDWMVSGLGDAHECRRIGSKEDLDGNPNVWYRRIDAPHEPSCVFKWEKTGVRSFTFGIRDLYERGGGEWLGSEFLSAFENSIILAYEGRFCLEVFRRLGNDAEVSDEVDVPDGNDEEVSPSVMKYMQIATHPPHPPPTNVPPTPEEEVKVSLPEINVKTSEFEQCLSYLPEMVCVYKNVVPGINSGVRNLIDLIEPVSWVSDKFFVLKSKDREADEEFYESTLKNVKEKVDKFKDDVDYGGYFGESEEESEEEEDDGEEDDEEEEEEEEDGKEEKDDDSDGDLDSGEESDMGVDGIQSAPPSSANSDDTHEAIVIVPTLQDLYGALSKGSIEEGGECCFVMFKLNGVECDKDMMRNLGTGVLEVFVASNSVTGTLSKLQLTTSLFLHSAVNTYISSLHLHRLGQVDEYSTEEEVGLVLRYVKRCDGVAEETIEMEGEGIGKMVKEEFQKLATSSTKNHESLRIISQPSHFIVHRLMSDCFEIKVFHQQGHAEAQKILDSSVSELTSMILRCRQVMALAELSSTREARDDLIPQDDDDPFVKKALGCDVKFESLFVFNHRLKGDVCIAALQSSILHPFEISNRRSYFVYKDVTGSIFYLTLVDCVTKFRLLVFGVNEPSGSVKDQLVGIIRNRCHMLALDALSSLLRSTVKFALTPMDVDFLRSFNKPTTADYVIKPDVDCYLLMLYLRQNVEGSGFFHRLATEEGWEDDSPIIDENVEEERDGGDDFKRITYRASDFTFYYNYTRSVLDAVSTLTHRGAELGRSAGKGICVLRFDFPEEKGCGPSNPGPDVEMKESRFKTNALKLSDETTPGCTVLRVSIVNTTLDTTAIKEWLQLCIRQSLVDYGVDKLMRLSRTGLLRGNRSENNMIVGFHSLKGLLSHGLDIPSMSVRHVKSETMLRGKSVRKCYERIMSDVVFKLLFRGVEGVEGLDGEKEETWPNGLLRWSSGETGDMVTADPSYTFVFGLGWEVKNLTIGEGVLQHNEVVVPTDLEDEIREQLLETQNVKRRGAIIFNADRGRRSLTCFNVNGNVFNEVEAMFKDVERQFEEEEDKVASELCLLMGSVTVEASTLPTSKSKAKPAVKFLRPTLQIRKPKLVGQSVDGSAIAAIQASRVRARVGHGKKITENYRKEKKAPTKCSSDKTEESVLTKLKQLSLNKKNISISTSNMYLIKATSVLLPSQLIRYYSLASSPSEVLDSLARKSTKAGFTLVRILSDTSGSFQRSDSFVGSAEGKVVVKKTGEVASAYVEVGECIGMSVSTLRIEGYCDYNKDEGKVKLSKSDREKGYAECEANFAIVKKLVSAIVLETFEYEAMETAKEPPNSIWPVKDKILEGERSCKICKVVDVEIEEVGVFEHACRNSTGGVRGDWDMKGLGGRGCLRGTGGGPGTDDVDGEGRGSFFLFAEGGGEEGEAGGLVFKLCVIGSKNMREVAFRKIKGVMEVSKRDITLDRLFESLVMGSDGICVRQICGLCGCRNLGAADMRVNSLIVSLGGRVKEGLRLVGEEYALLYSSDVCVVFIVLKGGRGVFASERGGEEGGG
ncbi:hypothetical protein TL16_g01895 [Triparma laevis f. inornata]|uniref:Uncharacterized protein n=1 Tax=Triparma laevis f. inornata TaxID=1714386 RepID=A0A9W7DUH2_9STRA|nr:hypothetical protein TL16_g01895 [Triparma laevis f. inornata]